MLFSAFFFSFCFRFPPMPFLTALFLRSLVRTYSFTSPFISIVIQSYFYSFLMHTIALFGKAIYQPLSLRCNGSCFDVTVVVLLLLAFFFRCSIWFFQCVWHITTFAKCFDAVGFNICWTRFSDKFHVHLNRILQSSEFLCVCTNPDSFTTMKIRVFIYFAWKIKLEKKEYATATWKWEGRRKKWQYSRCVCVCVCVCAIAQVFSYRYNKFLMKYSSIHMDSSNMP